MGNWDKRVIDLYISIRSFLRNHLSGMAKRILKGSFWVMIGSLASKILVFCATIAVVRIIGKHDYGQLSIIRSTIQMFVSLSAFGMGTTATKFIAQYRASDANKTAKIYVVANTFALCIAIFTSILIFIFAHYIAFNMLKAPELLTDIKIAAIILFFSLLNGAQTGTLAGFEDFKRIAKSALLLGVLELSLLSAGALLYGVRGAILGYGLSYCFAFMYNSYYIKRHIKEIGSDLRTVIRNLKMTDFDIIYQFSLPVALTSWIGMPCLWYSKTYLVNHAGFEEMALYDVSDQWRAQILFVPSIVSQALLPILSNTIAQKDKHSTIHALTINMKINGGITFTVAVILALLSPWVLKIYGSEYTDCLPLILLAFAGAIDSISNVCGSFIFSSNRAWSILKFNATWALVLVVVSLTMINNNAGASGLAVGYFLANITLTSLMVIKTYRILKYGKITIH